MRLQAHEPVQTRTLEKRDTTTLMYKNIRDIRSSIIKGTNYEIDKKYDLMGVELVFFAASATLRRVHSSQVNLRNSLNPS